ncbi:MAG: hypothetical protein ACYSVY_06420 [Planctomycetota bacterium]
MNRIRCFPVALISPFVLIMSACVATTKQPPRSVTEQLPKQDVEPSWWFPADIATGTMYHYQVLLNETITYRFTDHRIDERAEFAVVVLPSESGRSGCIVRMCPPQEPEDQSVDLIQIWIDRLAQGNPEGIWATSDAVYVDHQPLLRGPWRSGDRFSILGFGAWVLPFVGAGYVVGTFHFDVDAVSPTGADLSFTFWAGEPQPELRGQGELDFDSDIQGIRAIHAAWVWHSGAQSRDVELTVTRIRIEQTRGDAWAERSAGLVLGTQRQGVEEIRGNRDLLCGEPI